MPAAEQKKIAPPAVGNKKKKEKVKPIFKPYDRGRLFCGGIWKRILKVLGTFAAFVFISLIFGTAVGEGGVVLRLFINGSLLLVLWYMLFTEGAADGETDVALGETALGRREQGRSLPKEDADKAYCPARGFAVGLIAMLPFLLVTTAYAFCAVKQVYALQTLPSWVSGLAGVEEIGGALSYYNRQVTLGAADILRIISRLISIPYVNIVTANDADRLLTLDRMLPLTLLMPVLFYGIGYLSGPRRRAMIHGSIASNDRRRVRREKAARRRRAQGPRELV
ncbi:MAG: hypothetical protein IKP22_04890 [Clostridia bacterium]|nr:hypothetical protein [Clostridia bacterium]